MGGRRGRGGGLRRGRDPRRRRRCVAVSLFATRGLTVRFGGLTAVDHVDAGVEEGETLGLIGPNGSGKTTFFNAVTGLVPATGDVSFRGDALSGLGPPALS